MENKGPMPMTGESGSWNNGLFDCFSGGLCMFSPHPLILKINLISKTGLKGCCCPCFVYGKTQHRLRDPTLQNYESMNTDVRPLPSFFLSPTFFPFPFPIFLLSFIFELG